MTSLGQNELTENRCNSKQVQFFISSTCDIDIYIKVLEAIVDVAIKNKTAAQSQLFQPNMTLNEHEVLFVLTN